jgi:hypothetical protein
MRRSIDNAELPSIDPALSSEILLPTEILYIPHLRERILRERAGGVVRKREIIMANESTLCKKFLLSAGWDISIAAFSEKDCQLNITPTAPMPLFPSDRNPQRRRLR